MGKCGTQVLGLSSWHLAGSKARVCGPRTAEDGCPHVSWASAVNYIVMARIRSTACALFCLCTLLAWPIHCAAQTQPSKRLILKDGSYQLATKWEIKDDRVRFFSVERNEWEEIPNSLVDWDATKQYEADRSAGKMSKEASELEKEMQEERQEEELRSPRVAAGLRLPPEGGVYALDTYLALPELVPLDQSTGEVNRHTGHNVLRAAINPLGCAKHTIEVAGPRSKIQVHASLPAIYINLDASQEASDSTKPGPELPWDRFRIVRAEVKGDRRIVGTLKSAVIGKSSQEQEGVPATAEQMSAGWIKLTPKAPLEPGEYAVAELLGKQGMNSYVWDFGVHPDAPANLAVIRPDPADAKQSAAPKN
jgi:hypothetical protein